MPNVITHLALLHNFVIYLRDLLLHNDLLSRSRHERCRALRERLVAVAPQPIVHLQLAPARASAHNYRSRIGKTYQAGDTRSVTLNERLHAR